MRRFELTEIEETRPTIFLLNGGGQEPYNRFHKITKLFKSYNCNVVALEIPGHGKSSFSTVVDASTMLDAFYEEFSKICQHYGEIGLFGFSLGALLALKATEKHLHDYLFTIATGASIVIGKKQESVMQEITTVEFFERMRWMDIMKKYHNGGWQNLLDSISAMLHPGSKLFANPADFPADIPVHLLIGDHDEVSDYQMHEPIAEQIKSLQLHVIEETSHFEYFSTSWSKTKSVVKTIVDSYLDPKN